MWKLQMKVFDAYAGVFEFEFEKLEIAAKFIEKASDHSCEVIEFRLWKEREDDDLRTVTEG